MIASWFGLGTLTIPETSKGRNARRLEFQHTHREGQKSGVGLGSRHPRRHPDMSFRKAPTQTCALMRVLSQRSDDEPLAHGLGNCVR
jgi:hypothetical protein